MEKQEEHYEDEIELMDILNVVWKRKWFIIIPTLICVVLAAVYSLILPKVWGVETLILPSKFTVQTEGGSFEEVVVIPPKQITGKINEESYNHLIAAELNLDIREFPKLKAEVLKDSNLIKVTSKAQDVEKQKSIHLALFRHVKREADKNVDIEMKNIDSQIKTQQIDKEKIEDKSNALKNKLNIVRKRREEIEKSLIERRKKITLLEEEQNINLKNQTRNESETLGMLLYSNKIQQSLQYLDNLNESLSQKKIEEEDIKNKIEEQQGNIAQINNEIDNLNEKKGRIDYAQLSKEPTSSLNPVSPRKKLIVLIAAFLSLFIFTMLAFFLDYIKKNKSVGSA